MTRVDPELGTVRRCPRCEEWLPLDVEFWYRRSVPFHGDDWLSYCRACHSETRRDKYQRLKEEALAALKPDTRRRRERRAGPEGDAMRARQRAASKAFYWRNADSERERERAVRAAKAAAEGRTIRVGFGRPRIAA